MSVTSIVSFVLWSIAALIVFGAVCTSADAQGGYGGPPMWSRDPRDYRGIPRGPQMEPCIYSGQCRTPPIHDYPDPEMMPPPRMPPWPGYPAPGAPRRGGYWGDDDD